MFKPVNDFMIIEECNELEGIILPDNVEPGKGSHFIVKQIGRGYYENGILIKPEVQVGDKIACVGKILKIPSGVGKPDFLIARSGDVVAYERQEIDST